MRNFTLFAAMAAVSLSAAAAPSPMAFMIGHKERVEDARRARHSAYGAAVRMTALHKAALPERMKAKTVRTFAWEQDAWRGDDVYSYSYDPDGNVAEELVQDAEGDYAKTIYAYDANGMVTLKETTVSGNGVDFKNSRKVEFAYDPILTDVITERNDQVWQFERWNPGNCYKRIITRDEQGNITSAVIAVLFNGVYDPTQRLTVSYGEDGKANRISEDILNFNYQTMEYFWEQSVEITDITWEITDGQIYDAEDLFLGRNRIKTAHYNDIDDMSMDISVEYADGSDGYLITMEGAFEDGYLTATTEYTPLENGGYILEGTTKTLEGELLWTTRQEERYDEWGLMTYYYDGETEGDWEYYDAQVGEVEYDAEGKPAVYTVSDVYFDGVETETEYTLRAEYSDYVDVATGVSATGVSEEAPEKCFDLNGLRVASPQKGRIVIKDGKVVRSR